MEAYAIGVIGKILFSSSEPKAQKLSLYDGHAPANGQNIMILKIKLTPGVHLSLPWSYIQVYDHNRQTSLLVYMYIPDLM